MSHNLYFFTREPRTIDQSLLIAWAGKFAHLTTKLSNTGLQFAYRNPDTGVHFAFDFEPAAGSDGDRASPDGSFRTGIVLSLTYGRPTYFAYESMPLVEDLAQGFDLLVMDAQAQNARPGPCNIDELIRSWRDNNQRAVRAMATQGLIDSFYYLPETKADLFWAYRSQRAGYAKRLGEEVFVPEIFLFAPEGRRECVTTVTWNGYFPMIFPRVDYLVLVRRNRPWFGLGKAVERVEYAPAPRILEQIAGALAPFDGADDLSILTPDQVRRHARTFHRIVGEPFAGAFSSVALDGFIDVDFLSESPPA
ncbi:MAG: hypothetical protein OEU56_15185 [Rhodospirillales bacterium]|nr:hypothetical protein [Rhodospirillales bacterium]MDH3968358.1 hypothetical protein [Rhodospirillales bacterium]